MNWRWLGFKCLSLILTMLSIVGLLGTVGSWALLYINWDIGSRAPTSLSMVAFFLFSGGMFGLRIVVDTRERSGRV